MGLIAEIYKSDLGDCSNDGLSGSHTQVTIVNVDGPFKPTPERPAVMLVQGNVAGTVKVVPAALATADGEYLPLVRDGDKTVGPMMGGCYVSGDSRFTEAVERLLGHRFYGAVPLHDRFETPAQYEMLSR